MIGIYAIRNIRNGKRYIGQSARIKGRIAHHKYLLKYGKHHSVHLQRAWDQAPEDFVFEVIEECTEAQLCDKEEYWIRTLNSLSAGMGYNQLSIQHGRISYGPESRLKMSLKKKGKYDGRLNPRFGVRCPEHVKTATSNANSRTITLVSPDGIPVKIIGIKPFCRNNGLDPRGMFHMIKGTWSHYRGWTKYEAPRSTIPVCG